MANSSQLVTGPAPWSKANFINTIWVFTAWSNNLQKVCGTCILTYLCVPVSFHACVWYRNPESGSFTAWSNNLQQVCVPASCHACVCTCIVSYLCVPASFHACVCTCILPHLCFVHSPFHIFALFYYEYCKLINYESTGWLSFNQYCKIAMAVYNKFKASLCHLVWSCLKIKNKNKMDSYIHMIYIYRSFVWPAKVSSFILWYWKKLPWPYWKKNHLHNCKDQVPPAMGIGSYSAHPV